MCARVSDIGQDAIVAGARGRQLVAGGTGRMPLAGDQLYLDLDLSLGNLPGLDAEGRTRGAGMSACSHPGTQGD